MASEKGYYKIVKLLLSDERVDPSAIENYAIVYASDNGRYEIALSDNRIDHQRGIIIRVTNTLHYDVMKLLLSDERVDPSAEDN